VLDAGRVEGPADHAGQARSHLPADAEDDHVAPQPAAGVDDAGRGVAQQVVEVVEVADGVGEGHGGISGETDGEE
jgi:hypothetical protein